MRNLYARFVMFLIRPALELRKPDIEAMGKVVIDKMIEDARRNGPMIRSIRGAVDGR